MTLCPFTILRQFFCCHQAERYNAAVTKFEIISSIFGMLGFALGTINLVLHIYSRRPRLRIKIGQDSALFYGEVTPTITLPGLDQSRIALIASVRLEISNDSVRDNTIIAAECVAESPLLRLSKECRIVTGHRNVDLSQLLGMERSYEVAEYWTAPQPQLLDAMPVPLDAGRHYVAHLSFEVGAKPPVTQKFKIAAVLEDAHGRTYRKTVYLKLAESKLKTDALAATSS